LLAIGFVVMVSAIGGGLAALATSSVNNRNTLEFVRNREYAADGAIENAISQVRALTCASPGASIVDSSLNGVAIRVDWVNACVSVADSNGTLITQRNVIFTAFCNVPSDTTCRIPDVIIRAQVNFQDAPAKTFVQSWSVNR
jgi:hypothetical protein